MKPEQIKTKDMLLNPNLSQHEITFKTTTFRT